MSSAAVEELALDVRAFYPWAMPVYPTLLERAFTLARTGDCAGIGELRARLHAEGYDAYQLQGPSLLRQLQALCDLARPGSVPKRLSPTKPPGDMIGAASHMGRRHASRTT